MIRYCIKKWDENKEKLKEFLKTQKGLYQCEYLDLVIAVVEHILNPSDNGYDFEWDSKHITMIDNGDYQGTLLFLIPRDTYQPCEYDYLITYVDYGSCSGCDTLMSIQSSRICDEDYLTDEQVKDYMVLCKDILTNIKKPYNRWRNEELFNEIIME